MNEKAGTSSDGLLEPLTGREAKVLALILENKTNPEIAEMEALAPSSVKWYINQIFSKLGVKSRAEAVARAKELGLVQNAGPPPRNNLPRELTSFVGREEQIIKILRLVRAQPLVTLTGVGGTGKTRLALKVAEKALAYFTDGVWLVELAPIANHELLPQAVLNALGLREASGLPPDQLLAEFLRDRQALILLDNCEHVIDAAANLTHALLQACPRLHILATSREILGIDGETPFRCPSLSLPDPRHLPPFDRLHEYEAVRLFIERAERVSPGFSLSEDNAPGVVRICQRLDGVPLAIELAAARLRLLGVDQIVARLDNTFRLLTGGSRSDLPRHQTLKALIDWSYDLLSEKERLLLLRLSAFAGDWTLEGAEAVCADSPGGDSRLLTEEILDLLGQLVDKSLVEPAPTQKGDSSRYRMLETIRQYAHDHLVESGESAVVRERHLDYYLSLSLQAEIQMLSKHLRAWREKLDDEMGNLRLAMEWALAGSVEKGLCLAVALNLYWQVYLHEAEGAIWMDRLLTAEEAAPPAQRQNPARRAARGKALITLADIGWLRQDQTELAREATLIFEELGEDYRAEWAVSMAIGSPKDRLQALQVAREAGTPYMIAWILYLLFVEALWLGDIAEARGYIEENLAIFQKIGYLTGEKYISFFVAYLHLLEGDADGALELGRAAQEYAEAAGESGLSADFYLESSIALFQGNYAEARWIIQADLAARKEKGFSTIILDDLTDLGRTAWACEEYDLAEQYAEEAVSLNSQRSTRYLRGANYVLARTAMVRGQYEKAKALLHEVFLHSEGSFNLYPIQLFYQALGIVYTALPGQARRAAVLFGAQDFISGNLMNVVTPPERESYQQALAAARAALSEEEFAAAWAEGKAMNTDQAIQYALNLE